MEGFSSCLVPAVNSFGIREPEQERKMKIQNTTNSSRWILITSAAKRLGIALALIGCAFSHGWTQTRSPNPFIKEDRNSSNTDKAHKPEDPAPAVNELDQDEPATAQHRKRGTWIIAPIPISSPAIGSGLVFALGYVFRLDENDDVSPPSTLGVMGAFTNNGTRAGGLGGRLYFSENKYQTTFLIARGRVNSDFYGIGRIPGREAIKVPLSGSGTVFFGEFLRNVGKSIFIGPRFQHRKLSARVDGPQTPGGFEIPTIDLQSTTVALGFHVQRDKTNGSFYPTNGSLFNATADFFDQSLGSKRQYQNYKVSYNGYFGMGRTQVLAYRGMICSANQNVPFYDLCLFGVNNDLRGYTGGQFQNRRMFATQAEYRRELPKRLGVVAFAGIGGVAKRWNAFRSDEFLPAAGAGLRFKLDKKNHINYRIDWAIGRAGRTLSIGIGEAF